ncbi:MAG: biotin transporter BioY [Vampirovibrionales bacterium]|nr:biotin transporter BioY [Vampirovibrionales bacterium]
MQGMVITLPPLPKRPAKRPPLPLQQRALQGLPPRHGLKPLVPAALEVDELEAKANSTTPSALSALQTPPSQWTTATPRLTLPLLLLSVLAWIGLAAVGLLAAPLPNWSEGLLEVWQQAGNVTAPIYAHVWDAVWYRPQLPWAIACGAFLGPWTGMAVVALWLGLSLLGLPLMASGGGLELFTSPIFGFALGLVGAAGVSGWLANAPLPVSPQTIAAAMSSKKLAKPSSEETMTLLQRAQVPSLVALRRQKKLEEKRQRQTAPTFLPTSGLSLRTLVQRVVFIFRGVGQGLLRLQQGVGWALNRIRPSAEPQKGASNAFALPCGMIRLCAISLLATATAHTLGWLWLSLLSVAFLWPFGNPMGVATAQQFIVHWGAQLSTLSWGYDAVFGLCGLWVAQGLRYILGIILFE